MLDDALLEEFMHGFYGYGTYQGDYWFIGMEEGGGNSCEDISNRLQVWNKNGRRELEDVAAYHIALGIPQLFSEWPKLQRTWSKIIQVLLVAEGRDASSPSVRAFQRDELGRLQGNHCLVELLPLPSPSTSHWLYSDCSRLPALATRETYREYAFPFRETHLRERIQTHGPRHVVFYSFSYQWAWQSIVKTPFTYDDEYDCWRATKYKTNFTIIRHPATKGITNLYFQRIGEMLAAIE